MTQGVAAAPELAVLALQLLQTLAFSTGESAVVATGIALMLTKPDAQGFRSTANLRGNGTDGSLL